MIANNENERTKFTTTLTNKHKKRLAILTAFYDKKVRMTYLNI